MNEKTIDRRDFIKLPFKGLAIALASKFGLSNDLVNAPLGLQAIKSCDPPALVISGVYDPVWRPGVWYYVYQVIENGEVKTYVREELGSNTNERI